jgi:hypothetical protein
MCDNAIALLNRTDGAVSATNLNMVTTIFMVVM